MAVDYDPGQSQVIADPYPVFHRLQAEDPVHWSELQQAWLLTRRADIVAVLHDPRFSNATRLQAALDSLPESGPAELTAVGQRMATVLAYLDPPAHTRLRRLVNDAFRPRVMQGLRPRIQAFADLLLDPVQGKERMDLIADFAYPLTVLVGATMLGLPFQDLGRLAQWGDAFSMLAGPELVSSELRQEAERAMLELTEYFRDVLAQRRKRPGEDAISALIGGDAPGDRLSDDELTSACLMILLGGHRNLRNLMGIALLTLLRHPEQAAALQAEPALMPTAVEELLRYDFIEQGLTRVALDEVEIGGKTIQRGQMVLLLLGAANRDPVFYHEPDQLELRRRDNRHIAFGAGAHVCPGASLSRMVLEIAIATVLRRLPGLRLMVEAPPREERLGGRGLTALPVMFSPGPPRAR